MFLPKVWIICRICLKQSNGHLLNIFSKYREILIWHVLGDTGGIPVLKGDNFPDRICKSCLERLIQAYEFRLLCQRSHRETTRVVQYGSKICKNFFTEENLNEEVNVSSLETPESLAESISSYFSYNGSTAAPNAISQTESDFQKSDYEGLTNNETNTESVRNLTSKELDTPVAEPHSREKESDASEVTLTGTKQQPKKKTYESKINSTSKKPDKNNQAVPKLDNKICNQMVCDVCGKNFKYKKSLKDHMFFHANPYQCELCDKTFINKRYFNDHSRSHFNAKHFCCHLCPAIFTLRSNRNRHERKIHKRKPLHNYKKSKECLVCGEKFGFVGQLRNHHQTAHLQPKCRD